MQDLASEFSKNFPGVPLQPDPPRTQHQAQSLAGRGAQAPRYWDPNLGSLNFSAVVTPLRLDVAFEIAIV